MGSDIKAIFGQNILKDRRCLEGFESINYHFRGDVERHGYTSLVNTGSAPVESGDVHECSVIPGCSQHVLEFDHACGITIVWKNGRIGVDG